MNVQEVPSYAKHNTMAVMPLTDGILEAINQEKRVTDFLLPKNQVRLNPDFTVSSVMGQQLDKPGMPMNDLALRQICSSVAQMPAAAVEYYQKHQLGSYCSQVFGHMAAQAKEHNLKLRMYTVKEAERSIFAVNSENYQEFPKSQILEAFLRGIQDIHGNSDPTIGIKNLATRGHFAETIITPWQLKVMVVLEDFTGPRGDRYVSGIKISERGDGTGSCEIEWFLLRVVCANGLVDTRSSSKVTISHRGGDAFPRLLNAIRNSIAECSKKTIDCQKQIGLLPTIEFENPFAALTAIAEKDLGERRLAAARNILDNYVKEMGNNADAVLNTITDIGARDKVESARDKAQALGGRILRLTPEQWLRAHGRGQDILAQRLAERE